MVRWPTADLTDLGTKKKKRRRVVVRSRSLTGFFRTTSPSRRSTGSPSTMIFNVRQETRYTPVDGQQEVQFRCVHQNEETCICICIYYTNEHGNVWSTMSTLIVSLLCAREHSAIRSSADRPRIFSRRTILRFSNFFFFILPETIYAYCTC